MKIVIENSRGVTTLVQLRPQLEALAKDNLKSVFITISPSAKKTHQAKRLIGKKWKTVKTAYMAMTHQEQWQYLNAYMENVYIRLMEHGDWFYYVYEINESNNLHIHGILFSYSIQDEYSLKALQKTVYSHPMTLYNMDKKNRRDYMNEIVYFNGDINHIIKYFGKQNEIKEYFPDQYKVC